jgi:hypothetical protein
MNLSGKQALNEKIAGWIGFKLSDPKLQYCYSAGRRVSCWLQPNGNAFLGGSINPPDFCDSMDAHIAWSIPKLRLYLEITTARDGFLVKLFDGHSFRWDETNESMPLALSLAINYMIDNYKESRQ